MVISVGHHEACHPSHHGPAGGDTAFGFHRHIKEILHEFRGFGFHFRKPFDVRVVGCDAPSQGFNFCPDSHLCRWESGDSHLHADEFHSGLAAQHIHQLDYLADARTTQVSDPAGYYGVAYCLTINGGIFHKFFI